MPPKSHSDDINWALVRQRLKTAMDATAGRWEPPADARQRKLETVAKAFTRPHGVSDAPAIGSVILNLGGRRCVIEAPYVSEVLALRSITPLPRTPHFVVGLHNLRGKLLPVFDLHRFIEPAASAPVPLAWAVVCGRDQPEFMIATSTMAGAAPNFPEAVHERQDGVAGDWIRGETADGTLVLDGAALLADRSLFLGEVGGSGPASGKGGE